MSWFYHIFALVIRIWCRIVWRLRIDKKAPLPDGALILCSNHQHACDPLAVATVTMRQVHYMAKKELFQGKFSWFFRAVGVYPVDRGNNDVKTVRYTLTLLKQGRVIGIFPEGTRSRNGMVNDFHEGAAMFALRSKAHLIPIGIYGTFKPFSRVRIVVGEELDVSAYRNRRIGSDTVSEVNGILHKRVRELADLARGNA